MYKCIIKGEEVNIDSEQVLEEMLAEEVAGADKHKVLLKKRKRS